ncbi:unnamed protein product [Cladocopium goreaui]|uniref:Uncharacterized protein n=1 Tax=Cladocopium goreaui TaxID=2562237 RepID=A0A9P1BTC0_9DINO|nr:unnamed protein product [Cladocopium goreaui]
MAAEQAQQSQPAQPAQPADPAAESLGSNGGTVAVSEAQVAASRFEQAVVAQGVSIAPGILRLRSLQSAPQFFQEEYNTGERFTWCFAGFDCLRSSFYPEGFVLLEEDIQLEAEDVLALIPPRAHVPQQLSLSCCVRELLEQFHFEHRQGSEEKLFHILMHPFTLHALARGNTLKVFVTWTWKAGCFRVFEPMSPQSSSPWQHEGDEAWANWPLPVTSAGEVADVGLYARDVVKFGRKFIKLAGLRRAEPRALPGQAHASQLRSLEERNISLLEKCFFTERFTKEYLEQLTRCGVRLGVQHTMLLRTEELQVIRHLDNGVQQFVCQLPGERPTHTQSLWVSADGYFYALYIIPADVSHKSFKTPTMFIKAAG